MRFFSICILSFLIIGCGARSIYNSSYYSETALESDLIRVTFKGGKPPMTMPDLLKDHNFGDIPKSLEDWKEFSWDMSEKYYRFRFGSSNLVDARQLYGMDG